LPRAFDGGGKRDKLNDGYLPQGKPWTCAFGALRGKPRDIYPAVAAKMPLQASIFANSNKLKQKLRDFHHAIFVIRQSQIKLQA